MMKLGKRHIVALDIQDRYVKCAQLRYSSRSRQIEKTSLKEIPPSQDYEDTPHYTQTAHTIESLLKEMDIYPPKNLVTCIGGRDATVKPLILPPLDERSTKDVEQVVRYELMMQLPVNMDQMGYDYQVIEKHDNRTRVLTASAKRNVLNRHLKLLSLAGVYPHVVTNSALALFNAFAGKYPESIRNGRVGLLCLRDSNGDVVICENGSPIHARSFVFQASAGKDQLIRELHSSFDKYFGPQADENGKGGAESEADDMVDDLGHYETHTTISAPRIHLMTEDGQLPLGIDDGDLQEIVPGARWEMHPIGDDLVFGLAVSGSTPATDSASSSFLRINLLKQIAQEKRVVERKALGAKLARFAPAIAIVVLLAISGILWWQVGEARDKLYISEKAQKAEKLQMSSISQLREVEKELQEQIDLLSWASENYPMVSYRLYQIAQNIPDSLWLKEVYIPEQRVSRRKRQDVPQPISNIQVVGYAERQSHIVDFLSALRKCDCFSDVRQENTSEVRSEGQQILEFQIGLTSHPGEAGIKLAKVETDE
jgi:hypothetical protein